MREIRFGQIGGLGWMGRTHGLMYASVPRVFGPEPALPVLEMIAEADEATAREAAAELGARRWTADWRELAADPDIDVVDIVTPNNMHHEMALAAIAAGKHVYCEKPLARNAAETREMADAAKAKGVLTLVGYNYAQHPIHAITRSLIESGELGDLVSVRLANSTDFLAAAEAPFVWRCDRESAGGGAVGDLAVHLLSLTQYLIGDVAEVCGRLETVVKERRVVEGAALGKDPEVKGPVKMRAVDNDDVAHALLRFENRCLGILEVGRVHHGRKLEFTYDIIGTKGSVKWDYDRMNELHVCAGAGPADARGVRRIELGPADPTYGLFYPVANIGFGYNDMKMIEVRKLIEAVAGGGAAPWPDFAVGHQIQRTVDAIIVSDAERRWVELSEIP